MANNGWGIYGLFNSVYSTAAESFNEVWQESIEQVRALPDFGKSLIAEKEVATIVKNTAVVLATDLAPIIAAHAAMNGLNAYLGSDYVDPFYAVSLGLGVARWATRILTFRQTTEALTRIGILQAKQSSIFDKATKETRPKVSDKVCEDCTTLRYLKGGVRAPLAYIAHQGVIFGLNRLVGGLVSFKGFDFIVDSYSAQVLGQLIMDYRLANDGLCERHQHEYNQQFWERVFALGLPVVLIRKLISSFIESYTGVDSSLYSSMLESFISIGMVGLAHHIKLPEPVKESNRYKTPAVLVGDITAYAFDKVGPDVVEIAKRAFAQDGEPLDYKKAYKLWIKFYKDPQTQTVMMFVLPKMYLGTKEFVNDEIMRDYWPPLQQNILQVLGEVEKNQALLTRGVVSYVPNAIKNPVLAYFIGVPTGTIKVADKILNDRDFMTFVGDLKVGVTNMEVEINQKGITGRFCEQLGEYWPLTYLSNKEHLMTLDKDYMRIESKQVEKAYKAPAEQFNIGEIIQAVQSGVNIYYKKVKSGNGRWFNGSVGESRAEYYLKLLSSSTASEEHKLFVCLAILNNSDGPTLLKSVTKEVNKILSATHKVSFSEDFPDLRVMLYSSLMPIFYKLVSCNSSSVAKNEFKKLLRVFYNDSNNFRFSSEIPLKAKAIYERLNSIINENAPQQSDPLIL